MSDTDLYHIGEHPDGVRAICKECERVVLKDNEVEAKEVADNHNEQMHDGEEVAGVCAWDVEPIEEKLPDPDTLSAEKLFNLALALGRAGLETADATEQRDQPSQ